MKSYNFRKIEKKWQGIWEERKPYTATARTGKEKMYILDMFPYPSGAGLHVGHPEGYTATDIIARYMRRKEKQVLHPMGWDAFGLPAENYAIKTGTHPDKTTRTNIATFKRQIKSLGFSYDWDREVNTSDPQYYRWTQWLFLQLYKKGFAYKKSAPVNWCPSCKTVLANEQVVGGACERCGSLVEQKNMEQWFFKITAYADDLLNGLDRIDWPEPIKIMQRNWIGRSEGARVDFALAELPEKITVFTTRPDTLFGATFMVLAPEHPLVNAITTPAYAERVAQYKKESGGKSELERTAQQKDKSGVFTGAYAVNPLTGKKIPVWIAQYVLMTYGTGAIMAVPAHDRRDFEFAQKFDLDIVPVIAPLGAQDSPELPFEEYGTVINSGKFSGLSSQEAKKQIIQYLAKTGAGEQWVNYKLRDWLVSRQRYWGAPIPIIYCAQCGEVPVPEKDLPVQLPTDVDFKPTGDSPLTSSRSFHNVKCPRCGGKARRESDTMDTFVDSSWYYLRYADPHNAKKAFDQKKIAQWLPVDLYVGGAEHAVLHLLYSRFITKFLYDEKLLSFDEPFLTLKNQGLILGENGHKMSKSKGNVINPDEIVKEFGADSLRLYEMFMGPLEDAKPWSTNGLRGVYRFLHKVWVAAADLDAVRQKKQKHAQRAEDADQLLALYEWEQRTIAKVTHDIETLNFNTAISQMMEYFNFLKAFPYQNSSAYAHGFQQLISLLNPFAPHITAEIGELLGFSKNIEKTSWPLETDADAVFRGNAHLIARSRAARAAEVVIQINGKVRGKVSFAAGLSADDAFAAALQDEKVRSYVADPARTKYFWVQDKLLNIVVLR